MFGVFMLTGTHDPNQCVRDDSGVCASVIMLMSLNQSPPLAYECVTARRGLLPGCLAPIAAFD